ncbi:MAG TPA: O-antigen ligase family protein, partial [Bdellovibrio sp.]|nr:O-antigen ligase family protein [Bdellovibrio sp.]
YPVLSIGLVLNMSRAAVLSLFIFFAIKFLPRITWSCREFQRRYVIWGMLLFFGALIWGYRFFGSVDLSELSSGRTVIYQNALHYIYEHPLFGMGSWRYYDFSYVAEGIHAHNSYLELWATHGAISLILMGFIAKQIGPKNYLYLIPIFIFGLMNFSIFYVFSFGDIVMFYFLSTPQRKPAS